MEFNAKLDDHDIVVRYEWEGGDLWVKDIEIEGLAFDPESFRESLQKEWHEAAWADWYGLRSDYISEAQRDSWSDHAERVAAVRSLA